MVCALTNSVALAESPENLLSRAQSIIIDGIAEDWREFPFYSDALDDAASDPRNLRGVAVAFVDTRVLICLRTVSNPPRGTDAVRIDLDLWGGHGADVRLILSDPPTVQVLGKGVGAFYFQVEKVTVAWGSAIEVEFSYSFGVPKRRAHVREQLAQLSNRDWVRIWAWTWDHSRQQVVDQAPAAATMRLESLGAAPPFANEILLDFPLQGTWFFLQGPQGDGTHRKVWAYDLQIVDAMLNASTPAGSTRNAQYYSWGRQVFAPIAGSVESTRSGRPDGRPLTHAKSRPNYVVLRSSPDTVVRLGHFQRNSVRVGKGDQVVAGSVLGRVGNSGTSASPHLHIDAITAGAREGVPIAFSNVLVCLNNVPDDIWCSEMERWSAQEGFFVERLVPNRPQAGRPLRRQDNE